MDGPPLRKAEADVPVARSPLILLVLLALCLGVSAIGGAITATSVETWYPTLNKPSFTPPNWVFAPVWTTLYVMMAVAAWRVWGQRRRAAVRPAFVWFGVQLVLNLVWTALFFGLRNLDAALAEILLLLVVVAITTVVFFRIDRVAGCLFIPYLGWTAFGAWLMLQIWQLNRG